MLQALRVLAEGKPVHDLADGVMGGRQPAAIPVGELEHEAQPEGIPEVQQVERGIMAKGMELLAQFLEVLRVWVLHASVYARLELFVLVLGFVRASALICGPELTKR